MATLEYSEERKKRWFECHPCKRLDGTDATARHRSGKCINCGGCMKPQCETPPWCTDHRRSEDSRRRPPPPLPGFESPAKKLRQRKQSAAATITPTNEYSGYSAFAAQRMEEHDEEADEEREEGNRIGNLFQKDMNDLCDLPKKNTREIGSKLLRIVQQVLDRLADGDEEKYNKIATHLVIGLDPSTKGFAKLKSNIADLIIDGSQNTRQVGKALLLSSFTDNQAQQLLLDHDYSNRRQVQTVNNIRALNQQRKRAANKRGTRRYVRRRPVATVKFTKPLSTTVYNAKHRRNFRTYLVRGVDIPNRSPTTKIGEAALLLLVAFLYQVAQFRPGKTRNCRFHGHLLKRLPMYIRYSSIESLYGSYVNSSDVQPISYNSFREIVNALTRKGTYNQGLSYYYVDFIDKIEFAMNVQKILLQKLDQFEECNEGQQLKELIERLAEQIEESSRYLRHSYYARLADSDPTNLYRSVEWALGAKEAKDRPTADPTDPIIIVCTLRLLFYEISDQLKALLKSDNNNNDSEEDLENDLIEARSLKPMADLLDFELLHYTKHLTRGWWQEKEEKKMKRNLKKGQLFVTLDHKAKQYCIRKQESMTAYYGKQGMSMLGAMIQWRGELNEDEGLHTYFLDIVMANTASQQAHDVMAGIETVVESIESEEFQRIYTASGAEGSPKSIVLASDNALCNTAHTPFIQMLNSKSEVAITDWVNNEAQRGKSFLDGHFRFVSIHLKTAVLESNTILGDTEGFYDCLSYKDGPHASAQLFLQEEEEAKEILNACKKVQYNHGDTSKVHHISWCAGEDKNKVIHRHFTNMTTMKEGYKAFNGIDLQPSEEDIEELKGGQVLRSNWRSAGGKNKAVTVFLPFKGPGDSPNPFCCRTPDERDDVPPENTLAGLVYKCAGWAYRYGITPDQLIDPDGTGIIVDPEEIGGRGSRVEQQSRKIQELIEKAEELAEERQARTIESDSESEEDVQQNPVDCSVVNEFPPISSFNRYWAIKKRRPPRKLDPEVEEMFDKMFDQGKGYQNKDKKLTAERMTTELRNSPLIARRFDLQLQITPRLMQSKINNRATKDKRAADGSTKQKLDRRKKKAEEEEEYHSELDSDWEEDPADTIDDFEDDLECEDIQGVVEEVEELAVEALDAEEV